VFSLFCGLLEAHHLIPKINHPPPFRGEHFLFYFASITMTQVIFHTDRILLVYWSLCYEVTFYAIVASFLVVLGSRSKAALYTGLNVLTLGSLAWLIVSPATCPFPLNLWYQFGLGALAYMLVTHPQDRLVQLYFGAALVMTTLCAGIHHNLLLDGMPYLSMSSMIAAAFTVLLLGLYRFDAALSRNWLVQKMQWLGAISYSLYLSHYIVIPVPEQIAKKLGFINGTFWVNVLAQVGVAIVCAYVFHLLFERPFLSSRAKVREAQILSDGVSDSKGDSSERTAPSVSATETLSSPPATGI